MIRARSCSSWETEAGGVWGLSYVPRSQKQKTGAGRSPLVWGRLDLHTECVFFSGHQSCVLETNKQNHTRLGTLSQQLEGLPSIQEALWFWSPVPHKLAALHDGDPGIWSVEAGPRHEVQSCLALGYLVNSRTAWDAWEPDLKTTGGWGGGSARKDACGSSRGPKVGFDLWYPDLAVHKSPAHSSSRAADCLSWPIQCNLSTWHIRT